MLRLILSALAGFAIVTIVIVILLKWDDIVNWFRSRQTLKESDKANIAFTLQERLKNGDYKTIEGIFNKRTEKILDAKQVQSKNIDDKLKKAHQDKELVLYE